MITAALIHYEGSLSKDDLPIHLDTEKTMNSKEY